MKPQRIQRKRTKGWPLPENAVVVSSPSKWGNPFAVEFYGAEQAVQMFKHSMLTPITGKPAIDHEEIRAELRGKDLACWCPVDQPCHAGVLLEIANSEALS